MLQSTGSRVFVWDFADSLLSRVAFPAKQRTTRPNTKKLVEKLTTESQKRYERDLIEELSRRERVEIEECTFRPRTNSAGQYRDVQPRYQNPPSSTAVTVAAQTDDQLGVLRNPPAPLKQFSDCITMTDIVAARLDEGAVFYEEYRSQMQQLKGYHLNLMKLRHELRHTTA